MYNRLTDRQTDRRDIRLDIIRSLAIIGVIVLHVFGGIYNSDLSISNRITVDIFLAIARCSVNLFGLLAATSL